MIIALAYSHKDIHQAWKLVAWMSILGAGAGLKNETLLLVPSRAAASRSLNNEILSIASKLFRRVYCRVPETENENGWPYACNFMFREALLHAEAHLPGEDILWLEPDAIPLAPYFFNKIQSEWIIAHAANKKFLGAFVKRPTPHMSGIGVYGADWRKVCPSLADDPDSEPWDIRCASVILPNAQFTDLIHHEVIATRIVSLSQIRPEATIYHKDKEGDLYPLLDRDGKAEARFHFSQVRSEIVPMKFYYALNSTRMLRSQGQRFAFDPVDTVGGVHRGVYAAETESEIIALDALTANPASGVTEISQDEFESMTKKKVTPSAPSPLSNPRPQVAIEGVAGVVVESPASSPTVLPVATEKISSIDELVTIGTVEPIEPVIAPKKIKGKKRG